MECLIRLAPWVLCRLFKMRNISIINFFSGFLPFYFQLTFLLFSLLVRKKTFVSTRFCYSAPQAIFFDALFALMITERARHIISVTTSWGRSYYPLHSLLLLCRTVCLSVCKAVYQSVCVCQLCPSACWSI